MGQSTSVYASEAARGKLDDLASLRVFVRVVELENFSEVARRMGITPATVSKHVASLEAALRARLVNRTTRRLYITEAGQKLYEHCVRVMAELEEAQSSLSEIGGEPSGRLHATGPYIFTMAKVSPKLPGFMQRYPHVTIELDLSVEKLDLFHEHIDVALRIAESIDPGLVAFKLAPYRRVFCASPTYLGSRGVPAVPEDLHSHNCIVTRGANLNSSWPTLREGANVPMRVSGTLVTNNGVVARDAALAGLGVTMAPYWLIEDDLKSGRLVEVLASYAPTNRAVYAVLPRQGPLVPKVRAFVEFLRECCEEK